MHLQAKGCWSCQKPGGGLERVPRSPEREPALPTPDFGFPASRTETTDSCGSKPHLWYGRPSTLTCPADSSTVGRAYCQVHPGGRGHLGGCLALCSLGGMTGPLGGTRKSSCVPGAREGRPAGWAATVPGAPARGVEGPRATWFTLQRCGPDSHLQHHQKVRSPHRKPGGLLHTGLVETSWFLGASRRHHPPIRVPRPFLDRPPSQPPLAPWPCSAWATAPPWGGPSSTQAGLSS